MLLGLIEYIVIKRSENLIIDDEGVIIRNLNGFKNKIFWQHIKAIEPITIPIPELNQNIEFTGITIDEQYEQFYFDQMSEKQINVYMDNKEKTGCGFSIIGTSNIKTLQEALYSNRAIQR